MQFGIFLKSLNFGSYDAELLDVTGYLQELFLIPMLYHLRNSE